MPELAGPDSPQGFVEDYVGTNARDRAAEKGIVVAAGFGVKLYVERKHLVLNDGVGARRRVRRYTRATSKLNRVLVLGHSGFVTFEALRWLTGVGAAFVHIDNDGELVTCSAAEGTDLPALRRAQALAAGNEAGLEIARDVLGQKLAGQLALCGELSAEEEARVGIADALDTTPTATTVDELVAAESSAAVAYWDGWRSVELKFAARDRSRTPEHWLTFGQRHSPLTGSPRLAANPANAILNYLYSLLEAEAAIACRAVGLDPGIGVWHRDRRSRDSLTLDLMEACRPAVDAYVLRLLCERTFRSRDFAETRQGNCRVLPPLARELATTAETWRERIGPVVEAAAHRIADAGSLGKLPTPLTHSRRQTAWNDGRGQPGKDRKAACVPKTCPDCGRPLTGTRKCCDACLRERFDSLGETGRAAAAAVLAQLRHDGRDPAHGGEAGRRRGKKNAAHQEAVTAWNSRHGKPDPAVFIGEIAPRLGSLPNAALVEATGLSTHYCSLIRLGKRTPHPRHWAALRSVVESFRDEPPSPS